VTQVELPVGWQWKSIGEVCRVIPGFAFKSKDWTDTGIPVIKIKNIQADCSVSTSECDFIPSEIFTEKLNKFAARKGDILIAMTGATAGKVGRILANESFLINQRVAKLEPETIGKDFFWGIVSGRHYQELFFNLADGAAQPNMSGKQIEGVRIPVPPPQTQEKISLIIGSYDNLIENNTRRIEILEEMARRLYEEWFVQFRFPGHEGLAFENDVPQGWSRVRLDSVAIVNPEAISPKNAPDEIMYVDISSVSTRQVNKLQRLEFSEAPGRARRKVASGDVVWSCVRPGLRSYALIIDPPPNTIVSTGFAVVRADSVPFSYLYQVLGSDQFVSYLDNHATGAAYPAVKASDFEAAEVVLPCKNLLAQFNGAVLPMLKMIHVLRQKNNNLQSQRDLLLPKLISGEIDLSDIPMPI